MKRFINDIKKYNKYAVHSAKAYLKAEVANSYLNWLWWILDPLSFMLIYTFIFGVVFGNKEQYFPAFIFLGLTLWNFFNKTITQSVRIVKANKSIVSKVYLPKFILLIVKMLENGFQMLISFGIVIIMMIIYQVDLTYNLVYLVLILATLFAVTFGGGCILLHFGVFVEDLSNVVRIALRLLFYITGIFYNISTRFAEPYGKYVLKLNPIALVLEGARDCMLYGRTPDVKYLLIWLVIGLAVSVFGVHLIYKNENSYVKVI